MGAVCGPCEAPNEAQKSNTQRPNQLRRRVSYKHMHSGDFTHGITPDEEATSDELVDAFKAAVKSLDEDKVMHLDQLYPDLNMLEMLMRGSSLLHIAVQNKKHKLIVYCLENGLNV